MPLSSPPKHIVSPTDAVLVAKADTENTAIAFTTYTKYKEIVLNLKGTYRIKFDISSPSGSFTTYGKIYKNGVAYGTERSQQTAYATFSEDLNFDAGDLAQLYIKVSSGSGGMEKNFRIYGDLSAPIVNLDT